jgi:hypothetical protein
MRGVFADFFAMFSQKSASVMEAKLAGIEGLLAGGEEAGF